METSGNHAAGSIARQLAEQPELEVDGKIWSRSNITRWREQED